MYEGELELVNISKTIQSLMERRKALLRRFVRVNQDKPAIEVFKKLCSLGGMWLAVQLYSKANSVGVLEARKELLKLGG